MKNYRAYIFDLDGTLLDSKKDITLATNETIAHLGGTRLPEDLVASYVGHGVRDLVRQALAGSKSPPSEAEALAFFQSYYLEHCLDHSRLIDGVLETLEALFFAGKALAVFTNKPQIYTDKILAGLGIASYFKIVIGAEAGYPNKPAPAGGFVILSALGATPAQTLFVGDSDVDLMTAENLGMDCALALNGFTPHEDIMAFKGRAKYIYEDFRFLGS